MTTLEKLAELRKGTTPGNWFAVKNSSYWDITLVNAQYQQSLASVIGVPRADSGPYDYLETEANAEFIAACGSTDFASLSAEMDRMRDEITRLSGQSGCCVGCKNLTRENQTLRLVLQRLDKAARDGDDCQGAIMNEMEALGENA